MVKVEQALGGNVKVSIEVGRECMVFVWRMTVEEAEAEAQEIVRRMARG